MNMIGKQLKFAIALVVVIVNVAQSAPRRNRRSTVPAWHIPCGSEVEEMSSPIEDFDAEIRQGIESVSLQHQLMLNNFLNSDYDFLYEGARRGVQKHQYVPSWIPGKRDINAIKKLRKANSETIANHLPKLHTDMQKFAVAFEEIVQDAKEDNVHRALRSTQGFLLTTLCEIESVLSMVPDLQLPRRIERSIMSHVERNPVDETRRLVRDWGVLLKYKDYLHAWRHVFNY